MVWGLVARPGSGVRLGPPQLSLPLSPTPLAALAQGVKSHCHYLFLVSVGACNRVIFVPAPPSPNSGLVGAPPRTQTRGWGSCGEGQALKLEPRDQPATAGQLAGEEHFPGWGGPLLCVCGPQEMPVVRPRPPSLPANVMTEVWASWGGQPRRELVPAGRREVWSLHRQGQAEADRTPLHGQAPAGRKWREQAQRSGMGTAPLPFAPTPRRLWGGRHGLGLAEPACSHSVPHPQTRGRAGADTGMPRRKRPRRRGSWTHHAHRASDQTLVPAPHPWLPLTLSREWPRRV